MFGYSNTFVEVQKCGLCIHNEVDLYIINSSSSFLIAIFDRC